MNELQAAEVELTAAREALARVEHYADDRPALERYVRALERLSTARLPRHTNDLHKPVQPDTP